MEPIFLILILLSLLFTHWLGDFILQSDWQAKNKSKNNEALFLHVLTYTGTFFAAGFIANFWLHFARQDWMLFCVINGVLHFITDYFTSRLNTKLWNAGRVHDFFVSVGFDQLIHQITLVLTFYYIFLK